MRQEQQESQKVRKHCVTQRQTLEKTLLALPSPTESKLIFNEDSESN